MVLQNLLKKKKSKLEVKKIKSIYGKSKLLSTKHLLNLYKKIKFPVLIIRPYLIYGPGQKSDRLIPITILNCLKIRDLIVHLVNN